GGGGGGGGGGRGEGGDVEEEGVLALGRAASGDEAGDGGPRCGLGAPHRLGLAGVPERRELRGDAVEVDRDERVARVDEDRFDLAPGNHTGSIPVRPAPARAATLARRADARRRRLGALDPAGARDAALRRPR